jgi:DNA-binding LytR/AlgR family response regulator
MDIIIAKQFRIPLKTKFGLELIESSDIIYFFIENSKVNAQLVEGLIFRVYHTLTELESYLSEMHFYRCHTARLINLRHVKKYNHKTCIIELTNNLSAFRSLFFTPKFIYIQAVAIDRIFLNL